MTTRAAFDAAADTYDQDFTHTDLGRWLRRRVWQRLATHFQPDDFVLELGCGTGEDAVWLAQRGVRVLATDASPVMLQQTQKKAEAAEVAHLIQVAPLDLNQLSAFNLPVGQFDGVFSNFGPVNCTNDWRGLGQFLAQHVKSGGFVGLGVMSPFCLWETLWHGVHLNFKTAFRRLKRQTTATLPDGTSFPIYYPSPPQLASAFQPDFEQLDLCGLGVFLPPSDIFGVIEKRPRLAKRLLWLETHVAHRWPFLTWADHYWIEFSRQ